MYPIAITTTKLHRVMSFVLLFLWSGAPCINIAFGQDVPKPSASSEVPYTLEGFAIVSAKLWGLRSAGGHRLGQTPSLLSDTFVHNKLTRRCLMRRQDESLFPGVRYLSKALAPCRIKRRFSQTPQNSFWSKA